VLALAPRPGQRRWSGTPAETLPDAERDPDREPVAILEDGRPVGFFVLDRGPGVGAFAPDPTAVALRAFFVDARRQGHGVASRALAELPAYVRRLDPGCGQVVLSVNVANPAALAAYAKAGFRDTGRLFHGGAHGPQHVFVLDLGTAA
jgi:RimJ/RimL family protein N-acetyltransferase